MNKSSLFKIGGWLRLIAFHLALAGFVFASEAKNHPQENYTAWGLAAIGLAFFMWIFGTELVERGRP